VYPHNGEIFTKEEIQFEKEAADWYNREGAYSHKQKTKVHTLACGLDDSPIRLCAWMIEKFKVGLIVRAVWKMYFQKMICRQI